MAVFKWLFEQDITKPIKMRHDEGMTFTGDNDSYTIGVSLYNDGVAYSPSGSVSCNVIRADGVTVSFLGTVEGNRAVATLPANCLSIPGPIGVYIKLTSGSSVTTIFAGVYTVQATSTGSSVVPSETLTDIDALIAAVEAAVATIPPDYTDVINALPAVTGYVYPFPALTWTTGTYVNKDTGEIGTDDPNWSACDYIPIDPAYGKIKIVSVGSSNGIYNAYYNANKEYVGPLTWNSNTTTILQPPLDAAYIRLSRRNDTTVTVNMIPRDLKTWSMMSREVPISNDLNDCDLPGIYPLSASLAYGHLPDNISGGRTLMVFRYPSESYAIQIFICDYASKTSVHMRVRVGGVWKDWYNVYSISGSIANHTRSEIFTPTAQRVQNDGVDNVGTDIRVLQYNVANYNHDTSTYISDSNVFNLKKMLQTANADIMTAQEDRGCIDSENTKSTNEYIYYPKYPKVYGVGGSTLRSKRELTNIGLVSFSVGRELRYGVLNIDGKKLLVATAHCYWGYDGNAGDSAQAIAARKTQYEEMFKWCNGDITLNDYYSHLPVECPEHTHVVIGTDTNCVTSTDKTNLQTAASENGFILGNGGGMGWIYTCEDSTGADSIDVIAVSNNIIINNFEVFSDWYALLYSDHYPTVADLTLL